MKLIQRIRQYLIAPSDIKLTVPIFVIILITTLIMAITDSLQRFPIEADSYREYTTFLAYANLNSYWWRPLTDNMLSTCLWTTYLPAYIYKLFNFTNPEVFYRVALAVLISPAPALVYALAKKYANNRIAILLAFIFASSFYYVGFAEYARMNIALSWGILLLFAMDTDHKYKYWFIATAAFGLITSHYTVALIYIAVYGISTFVMAIKKKLSKNMALGFSLQAALATLFYGGIARRTGVLNYATAGINKAISYAGLAVPDVIRRGIPIGRIDLTDPADIRYYNIHKQYNPVISNPYNTVTAPSTDGAGAINPTGLNMNPLKGERIDFAVAEAVILCRFVIATFVSIALIRNKETRYNPIPYLAIASSFIAAVSTWLPVVAATIGAARIGWISMPFEIMALALWHNKDSNKNWLMFPLSGFIFLYH